MRAAADGLKTKRKTREIRWRSDGEKRPDQQEGDGEPCVQAQQGPFASIVHAVTVAKSAAKDATRRATPFNRGRKPPPKEAKGAQATAQGANEQTWQDNWRDRIAGVVSGIQWHNHHPRGRSVHARTKEMLEKGIAYERQLQPDKALQCFEEAYSIAEGSAKDTARLRVAKNMADMSMDLNKTNAERQKLCTRAAEIAQELVDTMPGEANNHVALSCCLGRLAIFSSNQMKVKLASAVKKHAELAECIDPENDLALHILGRWQNEAAQVNRFVRALIRVVYGDSLGSGSHEKALQYFQKASELNPKRLVHKLEVGRTYYFMGLHDLATLHLEEAIGMEVEDITDHHLCREGEELLRKLKGRKSNRLQMRPFGTHDTPLGAAVAVGASS